MFSAKKTTSSKSAAIATLISECCRIEGNVHSDSSIKIEGTVTGNVKSGSSVIVAKGGCVHGDIQCVELMIYGEVEGNVSSAELHLCSSGRLTGQIQTDSLHVEPGGEYQGAVSMSKKREAGASKAIAKKVKPETKSAEASAA